MKKTISCLALALLLCLFCAPGRADRSEAANFVVYNSEAMPDWSSSYSLTAPGLLLTLSKPDAEIHVIAYERGGGTPETHLLSILDDYGEYLEIQSVDGPYNWSDPWGGDGRRIGINFRYPDGDAMYSEQIYCANKGDLMIEIMLDCWGVASAETAREFQTVFLDENFDISTFDIDTSGFAYLSDVYLDEAGELCMSLNFFELIYDEASFDQSIVRDEETNSYVVSPDAMLWFPNANDPSASHRVEVDLDEITDAVLAYENQMGGGLAFNFVFRGGQIIWMDYYYLP